MSRASVIRGMAHTLASRARPCHAPSACSRLLALVAALPSAASAKGFSSGVASAEVTQKTALLWTRADKTGKVDLTVARDKKLKKNAKTFGLQASKDRDNTVQRKVGGLKPATTYYFRFSRKGAKSDRGTFRTAPNAGSTKKVRFAWTGDADPVLEPGTKKLHFGPFDVFKRMAAEGNAFNVNLGDTIYSDTDSQFARQDPLALSVAQKRAKYRTMLTAANLRRLRAAGAMYNHWDDHEFLNDFAIAQTRYPTQSGAPEGQPNRIVTVERLEALPRRREGVPRVHAGDLHPAEAASTARSAGARTSRSSSSTSARSATRAPTTAAPATTRRAQGSATSPRPPRSARARRSPPSCPSSRCRRRRAAWSGSTTRTATISASTSSTASRGRSRPPRRRSRSS